MPAPDYNSQDRRQMRDVTVMSLARLASDGTPGTAVDYLGVVETCEISLKREFGATEASSDIGTYSRPLRWGQGSVKITGFSAATASKFASLFAQGGHCALSLTEIATGDSYSLLCRTDEFSKSIGRDHTKDTISLTQEGVPFYGTAGGEVAAMVLD